MKDASAFWAHADDRAAVCVLAHIRGLLHIERTSERLARGGPGEGLYRWIQIRSENFGSNADLAKLTAVAVVTVRADYGGYMKSKTTKDSGSQQQEAAKRVLLLVSQ